MLLCLFVVVPYLSSGPPSLLLFTSRWSIFDSLSLFVLFVTCAFVLVIISSSESPSMFIIVIGLFVVAVWEARRPGAVVVTTGVGVCVGVGFGVVVWCVVGFCVGLLVAPVVDVVVVVVVFAGVDVVVVVVVLGDGAS